jgi:[acyl-carrier-protein] S-malonyltransferase
MKVTLVFPGQGSQYVGMANNFKEEFEFADKVLGYSLRDIAQNGPNDNLTLTQNTQPAIVAQSIGHFKKLQPILESKGVKIERVLGHSVGEYSALVAAGALTFEDALMAVHLRGKYMQEAVPEGKGKMWAILKVPEEKIRQACEAASEEGSIVMPANFNEPNPIVISGCKEACQRAVDWLGENIEGRLRAIELNVSAPFHSSLMKPAEEKLSEHLKTVSFQNIHTPYVANIDAKEYGTDVSAETIRENLNKQVCGSVLWTHSISSLPADTKFIEVGPGKVLSGLIRKINRDFKILHMDQENASSFLDDFLKD